MAGEIVIAMEKLSNKNHNGKAFKLKTAMENPSNINRTGKAFKTENEMEKKSNQKPRWKTLDY